MVLHIFVYNFLNIQLIFNLQNVLESWDLGLKGSMMFPAPNFMFKSFAMSCVWLYTTSMAGLVVVSIDLSTDRGNWCGIVHSGAARWPVGEFFWSVLLVSLCHFMVWLCEDKEWDESVLYDWWEGWLLLLRTVRSLSDLQLLGADVASSLGAFTCRTGIPCWPMESPACISPAISVSMLLMSIALPEDRCSMTIRLCGITIFGISLFLELINGTFLMI